MRSEPTTPCPSCGQPTIHTPDGVPLHPTPDLLGIHMPDGRRLTVTDKLTRTHGHHLHHCPKPEQEALFG